MSTSVADSGSGCFFDPWIRDPGWRKIRTLDPGSAVNIPDHISRICVKNAKFFDEDPDPGSVAFLTMDPESGMETFGFGILKMFCLCSCVYIFTVPAQFFYYAIKQSSF